MTALTDLENMTLFVHVVESGSLSGAGRALGVPKATVSRRIAQLEARLGAKLLHRSTRAMTPTDAGRRYFERASPVVREAALLQAETVAAHGEPSGLVRLSAPQAYGQTVLSPKLHAFLRLYPSVRLDVVLTDERLNFVEAGLDLGIRMGALEDSDLVQKRIDVVEMGLFAAPAYLDGRAPIETADDLRTHDAVLTRPDLDRLALDGETIGMQWRFAAGTMPATRDACVAGLGIARMPRFLAEPDLQAGRLVPVLANHRMPKVPVTLLRMRSHAPNRAVAALVEHLA